jgi:hypothetical protein
MFLLVRFGGNLYDLAKSSDYDNQKGIHESKSFFYCWDCFVPAAGCDRLNVDGPGTCARCASVGASDDEC